MFYPDKNKKYVKIRKNHRDYREENRKRAARNRIIGILAAIVILAVIIYVGYYFNVWQYWYWRVTGIDYTHSL